MRSLAERARVALECMLRAVVLAVLIWFLVRTILVQRHGAVYSTSCELQGGDADTCARFLETLRIP